MELLHAVPVLQVFMFMQLVNEVKFCKESHFYLRAKHIVGGCVPQQPNNQKT